MGNGKILTIKDGQEYAIYRTSEMTQKDILQEEYEQCARIIDSIVASRNGSSKSENNIVAFCGDRGTGKTSAMVNIGDQLINHLSETQLFSAKTKEAKFIPIAKVSSDKNYDIEDCVIDPSILDGKHGLLDIVLPSLMDMVTKRWNGRSPDIREREDQYDKLNMDFQNAYRDLSVLEVSDSNRDYEEDIVSNTERLNDLSSAIDLKVTIRELIKDCASFLESEETFFVMMIDDVDLCSDNAYRVLEEIRKYLMIPQIVIIMAVRIEQIEMCIREQNYVAFNRLVDIEGKEGMTTEIKNMAYKYMLKVIPESRRVILRNTADAEFVKVSNSKVDFEDFIATRIESVTGVGVPLQIVNVLRPNNLRALVNFILFFKNLFEHKSRDIQQNADKILGYIENHVIKDDDLFYNHYSEWVEVIESTAKWIIPEMNNLLMSYYPNMVDNKRKIVSTVSDLIHRNNEYKSQEKVFSLLCLICAMKKNEIAMLPLNQIIHDDFWKKRLREKDDKYIHVHVNPKRFLEIKLGHECNWLYESSRQNAEKLCCTVTSIPNKERELSALCLYELLLFADVSGARPIVSRTSASFINKSLEIGFDNFLVNVFDIEKYAKKTGLDEYFDKNEEADTTSKAKALTKLIKKYNDMAKYIQNSMCDVFELERLCSKLKEGRKYKEKIKDKVGHLTKEVRRLVNEVFGLEDSQKPFNKQAYDAFRLYQQLCEISSECAGLDDDVQFPLQLSSLQDQQDEKNDEESKGSFFFPGMDLKKTILTKHRVSRYIKSANVGTTKEYAIALNERINDCIHVLGIAEGDPIAERIHHLDLSFNTIIDSLIVLDDEEDTPEAVKVLYREFYLEVSDFVNDAFEWRYNAEQ